MTILYLHGFRSTPGSAKAQLVAQRMAEMGRASEYVCPQLSASPTLAAQVVRDCADQLIARHGVDQLAVIGSSLGGYYATWLAEQIGCRAVLLNPAVHPGRDLKKYIGVQTVYGSDQTIEVKPEFMDEFRKLWVSQITRPERYFLVAATGDEVLDWREMVEKYQGAKQLIIEGSDHGLSDFDRIVDEVLRFAELGGVAMEAGTRKS